MAIVPRKRKNGKTTYYVTFEWNGRTKWEKSGSDRRAAESLEKQRLREVADGTYTGGEVTGRVTVRGWFDHYFALRKNRTLENDVSLVTNHVLSIDWLARKPMADLSSKDSLKMVETMRAAGKLGEKSIATVFGIWRGAMRRAKFDGVVAVDVWDVPKALLRLRRKTAEVNKRKPYSRAETHELLHAPGIRPDARVFLYLAFFTGMREGEICGRRWGDWLTAAAPLTALHCHSQYSDEPLKGDEGEDTRPRMIPVHPDLETILRGWWSSGWELVYGRKPTAGDFIVPMTDGVTAHTKRSGYGLFQRARSKTNVPNRSLHSTRHTFVSIARSNGARVDVLERVTHNASGQLIAPAGTIDDYTSFEWTPLCEAVAVFDVDLDPKRSAAVFTAPEPGLEAGATVGNLAEDEESEGDEPPSGGTRFSAGKPLAAAWFDARQRKFLKLAEIDPEAARPGLAVCRALAAARRGDDAGVQAALADAAEALGFTAEVA